MPRHSPFVFIDVSPALTRSEKKLISVQARTHSAKVSHEKRKKARYLNTYSHIWRRLIRPTKVFTPQLSLDDGQHELQSRQSETTEADPAPPICQGCGLGTTSASELDNNLQRSCECGPQIDLDSFRAMFNYPAQRPGWSQRDIADMQFFMGILGAGVRYYSVSGFFNIVVPSLSTTNDGIRNLVLGLASTHRSMLAPKGLDRRSANVQALERFNKAINHLSTQASIIPSEVVQASCILLACWYMLRLDAKDTATCTRIAESLCHMDREMRLRHRIVSGRNHTDPKASINYRQSSFATIIAGLVAKCSLDPAVGYVAQTTDHNPTADQLMFSSTSLRYQLRDIHDVLSSLEVLAPIYNQLMANTTYHAHIRQDSSLTQLLLARIAQIATIVHNAPAPQDEGMWAALGTLGCWQRHYWIGLHCQLLSNSEMAWDEHTNEFELVVAWPEEFLSLSSQGHIPFVFLPMGIVVQPLWFTAVHCRDPTIRRRAIDSLLNHHRNEIGLDSWFAGHVAMELMHLEEGSKAVSRASDIPECDRILLRGFEYVDEQLHLFYMYATDVGMPEAIALGRHSFSIPKDPHGVVQLRKPSNDVEHLRRPLGLVAQATPETAPRGYIEPMYCDGEFVEVVLPETRDK